MKVGMAVVQVAGKDEGENERGRSRRRKILQHESSGAATHYEGLLLGAVQQPPW